MAQDYRDRFTDTGQKHVCEETGDSLMTDTYLAVSYDTWRWRGWQRRTWWPVERWWPWRVSARPTGNELQQTQTTSAKCSKSPAASSFFKRSKSFYLGSHGTVSVFWLCCCHHEAAGISEFVVLSSASRKCLNELILYDIINALTSIAYVPGVTSCKTHVVLGPFCSCKDIFYINIECILSKITCNVQCNENMMD